MDVLTKILSLLNENNKTQQDLASYLGVTKHTISDWKSGKSNSLSDIRQIRHKKGVEKTNSLPFFVAFIFVFTF